MHRVTQGILIGAAVGFLTGCASTGAVQRYPPKFSYTPPSTAKPGAADVTFLVVGARYPGLIPLFAQFGQNLSRDFITILEARGFTIRGPFRTYDDITFPDKKGSDLILTPELQINGDASHVQWEQGFGAALLGATSLKGEGDFVITGRVSLVVAESLSREKMWTKTVDIPAITIHFATTHGYTGPATAAVLLANEDELFNEVAKALDAQYNAILGKTYQYLDPEEMQIVKKQAQEIRTKKVY